MPSYIYFCTDVLIWIYKCELKVFAFVEIQIRFKFKTKTPSKPFENHCFPFLENILGFKIRFKFDFVSKPDFEKNLQKPYF
jgi:hypothetical protein